jgi:hypothetical protein
MLQLRALLAARFTAAAVAKDVGAHEKLANLSWCLAFKASRGEAVEWFFGMPVLAINQGTAAFGLASQLWVKLEVLNSHEPEQGILGMNLRFARHEFGRPPRCSRYTRGVAMGRLDMSGTTELLGAMLRPALALSSVEVIRFVRAVTNTSYLADNAFSM